MKLWLRDETKANERRTPLTPQDTQKILDAGIEVVVEESNDRIFKTEEYKRLGCKIVPAHSWKDAPKDYVILGLKEIEDDHLFYHHHIYFAHVFKGQSHADKILSQYKKGGGTLYDLEYLTNEEGRRVCAFGHWAGFAGAAFALDRFYHKKANSSEFPALDSYPSIETLFERIQAHKDEAKVQPRAIIIGALGRCGNGAKELFNKFQVETTLWDYPETKAGGPFKEIIDHHIFVNAALITKPIEPFLTKELANDNQSQLEIIADVSCDPNSDLNPIPLYNQHTSWKKPFLKTELSNELEIMSVDNLPSTLPRESSIDFSSQLTQYLIEFLTQKNELPTEFANARDVFEKKLSEV
tara:strand:+ start:1807 stop:2868 length:1062 start_codon:yes stop_codon:yes gene_type:complete